MPAWYGGAPRRNNPRTWTKLLVLLGKFLDNDPGAVKILDFAQEQSTRMAEFHKEQEVAA